MSLSKLISGERSMIGWYGFFRPFPFPLFLLPGHFILHPCGALTQFNISWRSEFTECFSWKHSFSLCEMIQHSKCLYFFPPLTRALTPVRTFCVWYEVVGCNHTRSGTRFKSMKRENWKKKKMLLSSSLYQRRYVWNRWQTPNTQASISEAWQRTKGFLAGT